jgi:creatinine amidohydrolase
MVLADSTWPEVAAFSKEAVVLIPTGSLEQHGPHLPLFTDSILAGAVASAVEARLPQRVLLTPTLWLGASGHHLAFPGSLSNSFEAYIGAIESVAESLIPHGFSKFYVINGHGGNTEPNGIAIRKLKARHPELTFGHSGYFAFAADQVASLLEGPTKEMRHACEAEASLILHLRPELVRKEKLRDDGLQPEPPVRGVVHHFDEITEQGSLGYATYATAEKGKRIFDAAVEGAVREIEAIAKGYALVGKAIG